MAVRKPMEDGIGILRFIARSDAIRQVRGRIRDGASRVAENDRVPRMIAGSAGILAALLSEEFDSDETLDEPELEPSANESTEDGTFSRGIEPEGEDEAAEDYVETVATVRDLEGTDAFDSPPDMIEEELEDEETNSLPFSSREDPVEGEPPASPPEKSTKPARVRKAGPGSKGAKNDAKNDAKNKETGRRKSPTKSPTKSTKSANAAKGTARKVAKQKKAQTKPTKSKAPGSTNPNIEKAKSKKQSAPKPKEPKKAEKAPLKSIPPGRKKVRDRSAPGG